MSMLIEKYKTKRGNYEQLENSVTPLLTNLVKACDVEVLRIEGRTKSIESLEEKINRSTKNGKYNDLEDITDLCGFRIITFGENDSAKISEEIRRNFIVDEQNSVDKTAELNADQFGYRSRHFVVAMTHERLRLFEYKTFNILKFEIQVRTVLQHAWASLDWKLRYKSEVEAPVELRRKLYRVSALLEAAEDTFSDLQDLMAQLRENYALDVSEGKLSIPINKDSLNEFFKTPLITSIISRCSQEKVTVVIPDILQNGPWDYLIQSLSNCGIHYLIELQTVLMSLGDENFKELTVAYKKTVISRSFTALGIFSAIRFLVLTTLSVNRQKEITSKHQSGGRWGKIEYEYFESKS